MRTTGIFSTHRQEIEVSLGSPFKIIPFGDVHRDSDMHCSDYWQQFLDYAKAQSNAVFLGMGDYTDGVSTTERIVLSNPALHDTTTKRIAKDHEPVIHTLADELSFMKGRLIGLLGGNHYFQFQDGNTSDHKLAGLLDAPFLGVCSFIRLSLRIAGRLNDRITLDILAHHGAGGGRLAGSTFNKVEQMQGIADADIYLMGHDHNRGCIPAKTRLRLISSTNSLTVRERVPWLGRTGSFLKAYEPGTASYNVDANRAAVSLGWIEFEITPYRDQSGGDDHIAFRIRGTA